MYPAMKRCILFQILDYGNTIWFLCSQSSQKTLQSVQNKGMRCILNIPNRLIRSHPVSDLLDTLDWTDLRTRRQQHRCRVAFRSLRGDVPPYLLRLLSKRHSRNRLSTRASFRQTFDIPLTANQTADCAFSVTMTRILNNFDDVLLDAANLQLLNSNPRSHSLNLIYDNTLSVLSSQSSLFIINRPGLFTRTCDLDLRSDFPSPFSILFYPNLSYPIPSSTVALLAGRQPNQVSRVI